MTRLSQSIWAGRSSYRGREAVKSYKVPQATSLPYEGKMLEINNLDAYYKNLHVLHGVSVHVNEGELVTLIGSNGAGKTTLLMTICGLVREFSGTILHLGTRLDKLPAHGIYKLGIVQVPQGRRIFPEMTVFENLKQGAYRAPGVRSMRQNLEEVYGYFPVLVERKDQKAGTLSGGEQQMLAIGRALMSSPRLLLIDEPSSGLSPLFVDKVAQIIADLHRQGLTMLLVEQNAHLALELADRGYVLENGEIVTSGAASELSQSDLVKTAYLGL